MPKGSRLRGNNEVSNHYLHSKMKKKINVNRNMCFQGFPGCKTFSCNCINKSQRMNSINMLPLTKQNKIDQQVKTASISTQLKKLLAWKRGKSRVVS